MYYKKEGMPEEGEVVVCTVTKIHPTSVFVKLEHFHNKVGILHISEIAPGRIRNLNEYVSEGKTLVCQVLKVNTERGNIDLSLRRVSDARRIKKMSEVKQELKAEKIVESAAEELKVKFEDLYPAVVKHVLPQYEYLFQYFTAIVKGEAESAEMELPKNQESVILEIIKQRIKPPVVELTGVFKLKNFSGDGVSVVKSIIKKAQDSDKAIDIKYAGGGAYPFVIQHPTFEGAEKIFTKVVAIFEDSAKDKLTQFSFERSEGKQVES